MNLQHSFVQSSVSSLSQAKASVWPGKKFKTLALYTIIMPDAEAEKEQQGKHYVVV